jgi:hypothetical protein
VKLSIGDKFTYGRAYATIPAGTVFTVIDLEDHPVWNQEITVTYGPDNRPAYFSNNEVFDQEAIKVSFSKGDRIRAITPSAFGSIEVGDEFDVLETDERGRVRIQLTRSSKTNTVFWGAELFKLVGPKAAPQWVVGTVDMSGKASEKRHDRQQAAAADIEDLMELLADTERPLIQSITIKYDA